MFPSTYDSKQVSRRIKPKNFFFKQALRINKIKKKFYPNYTFSSEIEKNDKIKYFFEIGHNYLELEVLKFNINKLEISFLEKYITYQFFFISSNGFNCETLINEAFALSNVEETFILDEKDVINEEEKFDNKSIFFTYDILNSDKKVFSLLTIFY
jgi:hypothetical protein